MITDPVQALADDLKKLESPQDFKPKVNNNNMTTGIVEDLNTKSGANYFQYRFKIDGDWYGMFTDKGKFDHVNLGDTVEFTFFEKGKYKNINDDSFEVVKAATKQESTSRQQKNDQTGERIFYSGTQKPAVELVAFMVSNEIVKLPTKQADKMDAVLDLVKETTKTLAHQVNVLSGAVSEDDVKEAADDGIKE